jgi:hypothetical protein
MDKDGYIRYKDYTPFNHRFIGGCVMDKDVYIRYKDCSVHSASFHSEHTTEFLEAV